MKLLFLSLLICTSMNSKVIFDFSKDSNVKGWVIVDDGVMGGKSAGNFDVNTDGNGIFEGRILLENNGGFSSLRYNFSTIEVKEFSKVVLRIKGDGKDYQFRVKNNSDDAYSYIAPFSTSGEWQEVEILLAEMYPSFRGRKLDKPNFQRDSIEELTFLIGNKKEESFKLIIDKIELR